MHECVGEPNQYYAKRTNINECVGVTFNHVRIFLNQSLSGTSYVYSAGLHRARWLGLGYHVSYFRVYSEAPLTVVFKLIELDTAVSSVYSVGFVYGALS